MKNYKKFFFQIIFLLFFPNSVFSDPYYFINVPYGTFLYETPNGREDIFIPSFSRIDVFEEEKPNLEIGIYYDSYKKIKFKNKIGFIPNSYIGTYNIFSRVESPDKSKYFEIISPYKNCNCNMYEGYIHSCFMEISSSKNSTLIKRIGNEKKKYCWDHYWRRATDWFNENELLVEGFNDGDAGGGDRWNYSMEKVNLSTEKLTNLFTYRHLSCKSSEANTKLPAFELTTFDKIFIHIEGKLYQVKFRLIDLSFKYDQEANAYDCKYDLKKMKLVSKEIILYRDRQNQVLLTPKGDIKFFYNGKEISLH